jgi:hypothetical protein
LASISLLKASDEHAHCSLSRLIGYCHLGTESVLAY